MGGAMATPETGLEPAGFWHGALVYDGDAEFVASVGEFLQDGLEAGEPTLVVVGAAKIGWLRDHLGPASAAIRFEDMDEIGTNPGRIIGYWRDFVDAEVRGRRLRGVGEPVFPARSPAELAECNHHEALLNTAFDDGVPWRLLCPYDRSTLPAEVLDDAERNHPVLLRGGAQTDSGTYVRGRITEMIDDPLPEPATTLLTLRVDLHGLGALRDAVAALADRVGLPLRRAADLVLAVSELAANSVRHGGGGGTVRCWQDGRSLVCEVSDAGHIADPLVGRSRPRIDQAGGRGVWIVHHLCDLVQLRTSPAGTVVRVHAHLA
jgi:anti-sigma regulatory factor (Ser/Thr protein kinase)